MKRLEMRSLGAIMFSFKWTSHARETTARKMPSEWCKEGGMSGQKILTNDLIKIFTLYFNNYCFRYVVSVIMDYVMSEILQKIHI